MKKLHEGFILKDIVKSNITLYVLLIILSLLCIPLIVLILKFKILSGIFGTLVVMGIILVTAMGFTIGMRNLINALSEFHNT